MEANGFDWLSEKDFLKSIWVALRQLNEALAQLPGQMPIPQVNVPPSPMTLEFGTAAPTCFQSVTLIGDEVSA